MEVLNPYLYNRLNKVFAHDGGVRRIANRGVEAAITHIKRVKDGKYRTQIDGGEKYVLNCPFCGDTKGRLYVGYLYGTADDADDGRFHYNLAVCFRRDCLKENWWKLRNNVVSDFESDRKFLAMAKLRPGQSVARDPNKLVPVSPPGAVVTLTELPSDHIALQYLRDQRKYDPEELAKVWRVGVCLESSEFWTMEGRIYVPMTMDNVLVGWQGRWPRDLNWKTATIPKYYNLPGMPKSLMLYGYDTAKNYPTVVLCEGVSDVWRIGPQGCALLGKTLSPPLADLVVKTWGKGVIIILLDGNDPDAVEKANRIERQLKPRVEGVVINARPPDGLDPGMIPREQLWELLTIEAEAAGAVLLTPETALVQA